jgi:ribosomal protein S18 acetylase RimI-like enzyme
MVRTIFREATSQDAEAIAAIHADSWRNHYRGALPDTFLDKDVKSERLAVWTERLLHPRKTDHTIVADRNGAVVAFAHLKLQEDPVYGALLDNLHVSRELKRQGIGKALMRESAAFLVRRDRSSGLYLWVLEQNRDAQAFYLRLGAVAAGSEVRPICAGVSATELRMYWPNPSTLLL